MIDVHYASLTSQRVQHRRSVQMVTHPHINLVQQGLTSMNKRDPVFPFRALLAVQLSAFCDSIVSREWEQVSLLFLEETDDEDI